MTFDSKPLLSEVSILGEIDVRLGLTVSGTAASVAVRLCEVKPNGQSWLIANQVQNLSGKLSVDGETSAVLRLGATAHRFAKGSQISVAISQSLWPLVWPLAQATTMTLRAGTITLPEATSSGVDLDLETQSFPSAPLADYAVQPHDTDGRLRLENHSGPTVDIVSSAVGQVEITRSTEEISEIVQTDPQSAVWTQTVKQRWRRDGWDCGLEAGYRLTCDEDTFHLKEWLRATFQSEEIFTQEELNNIPRRQR